MNGLHSVYTDKDILEFIETIKYYNPNTQKDLIPQNFSSNKSIEYKNNEEDKNKKDKTNKLDAVAINDITSLKELIYVFNPFLLFKRIILSLNASSRVIDNTNTKNLIWYFATETTNLQTGYVSTKKIVKNIIGLGLYSFRMGGTKDQVFVPRTNRVKLLIDEFPTQSFMTKEERYHFSLRCTEITSVNRYWDATPLNKFYWFDKPFTSVNKLTLKFYAEDYQFSPLVHMRTITITTTYMQNPIAFECDMTDFSVDSKNSLYVGRFTTTSAVADATIISQVNRTSAPFAVTRVNIVAGVATPVADGVAANGFTIPVNATSAVGTANGISIRVKWPERNLLMVPLELIYIDI